MYRYSHYSRYPSRRPFYSIRRSVTNQNQRDIQAEAETLRRASTSCTTPTRSDNAPPGWRPVTRQEDRSLACEIETLARLLSTQSISGRDSAVFVGTTSTTLKDGHRDSLDDASVYDKGIPAHVLNAEDTRASKSV